MEEMPERLELLAQRVQLRGGAASRRGHGRGHLGGRLVGGRVARGQGWNLLLDQVDGLGQALVRMAQHRFMTTLPWPSSSQRSSFRAASSRLAIPSRRAQRTAATKAFLPKSGFGE